MSSRRRRPVRSVLECTSAAGLNRQEVASDSSKASEDGGDLDTTGIENLPPQSQLDNDPGSTVLDRTGHGTHFPHRASAVKYQVNDYVYLRPETLPEPFYIGRIMEEIPKSSPTEKAYVRIAWFARPRDIPILAKRRLDHRLLFATMQSDINPVSAIRGKAFVRHTADISNLEQWKRKPDHFYFDQLYDRYTKRFFDLVPLVEAVSLPLNTRQLLANVAFISVEQGTAHRYTQKRICLVCQKVCAPSDDIQSCSACKEAVHYSCLGITKLPSKKLKGYAWECANCSGLASEIDIPPPSTESDDESMHNNVHLISKDELKSFLSLSPQFPFRYFGVNITVEDLLHHPEDGGLPKVRSRIGDRYQAEVSDTTSLDMSRCLSTLSNGSQVSPPDTPPQNVSSSGNNSAPSSASKNKRKKSRNQREELEVDRYLENTCTFSYPSGLDHEMFEAYLIQCQTLFEQTLLSGDQIDACLGALHLAGYDIRRAVEHLHMVEVPRLKSLEWTDKEKNAFASGLIKYGHDLTWIQKEFLPKKSLKSVVQHFYLWKKSHRLEYVHAYSQYCKLFRPQKYFKELDDFEGDACQPVRPNDSGFLSDVSVSDFENEDAPRTSVRNHQCWNCDITKSTSWKLRTDIAENAYFCSDCQEYWKLYANQRQILESEKRVNREGQSAKSKRRLTDESTPPAMPKASTTQPVKKRKFVEADLEPQTTEVVSCVICGVFDFMEYFFQCAVCEMHVHSDCHRLICHDVDLDAEDDVPFRCLPCRNKINPFCSVNHECISCQSESQYPLIPTIAGNWIHIQCALWNPDVQFLKSDFVYAAGLGRKGAATVEHKCFICDDDKKGHIIKCNAKNCSRTFHVMCAQEDDNTRLGIEHSKSSSGGILLTAYCRQHSNVNRSVTAASLIQALESRLISTDKTHCALLSESNSLTSNCSCHFSGKVDRQEVEPVCSKECDFCKRTESPFWFEQTAETSSDDMKLLCQNCIFLMNAAKPSL